MCRNLENVFPFFFFLITGRQLYSNIMNEEFWRRTDKHKLKFKKLCI